MFPELRRALTRWWKFETVTKKKELTWPCKT
jgi:hypothetical protein